MRRRLAETIGRLDMLKEYPFLKAALEDLEEIQLCTSREVPNRRHVVCLMFDVLEFVLYEILLLHEKDIYRTGQNTIGFDAALNACRELGVEVPLIAAVRDVQKHRGDAKHHAQNPDEDAFQRLRGNFDILLSRLVHEQFEGVLGETLTALPLVSHQLALFESYRRRRNHNWEQAYRFILGALLQKHREMFGQSSELPFKFSAGHRYQLGVLEKEIAATDYKVAPQAAADLLRGVVARIKEMLSNDCWEEAASRVIMAYSTTDQLLPSIFDINRARCLTPSLYQPSSFSYGKSMLWGKVWGRAGSEEEELTAALAIFLRANSDVVKSFGQPNYAETDDRYWRWWEFAIFDGERWHTFHLNTSFEISLEVVLDPRNGHAASTHLLKHILGQFHASKEKAGVTVADHEI